MYKSITQAPHRIEKNMWHNDLTNDQHHSMRCISSSQLKFLHEGNSLEDYKCKYVDRLSKSESSEEFRIGTIAHLAVLEPDKFNKQVFVCDHNKDTIAYREYRLILAMSHIEKDDDKNVLKKKRTIAQIEVDEQKTIIYGKNGGFIRLEDNEEIFLISQSEFKMHETFRDKANSHPEISRMLKTSVIEQSGFAQDPITGLWMSVRGDIRNSAKGYFGDPKTIGKKLTQKNIQDYMVNYGLAIQAAHYHRVGDLIDGFNNYKAFFFIFLSKVYPYSIACFELDRDSLDWGHNKCRMYLDQIAYAQDNNFWPSIDYNETNKRNYKKIGLPYWELRK